MDRWLGEVDSAVWRFEAVRAPVAVDLAFWLVLKEGFVAAEELYSGRTVSKR